MGGAVCSLRLLSAVYSISLNQQKDRVWLRAAEWKREPYLLITGLAFLEGGEEILHVCVQTDIMFGARHLKHCLTVEVHP